jgi:poly(3-hydroxybutyrate) depolymerase
MAKRLVLGVLVSTLALLGVAPAQAAAPARMAFGHPADLVTVTADGAPLLGGAARTGGVAVTDDLLGHTAARVSGTARLTDGSRFSIDLKDPLLTGSIHARKGNVALDVVVTTGVTRPADDVVEWSGPALVKGAIRTVKVTITDRQADPGFHLVTMKHAGQDRTAFVRVPPHPIRPGRTPVLFHFPGLFENAAFAEQFEHPSVSADEHGFLLVIAEHYGVGWQGVPAGTPGADVDDPGFVRELAAHVQQRFGGDARRTYASGMSNGGFFTSLTACKLPDVFAAYAPVAGQLTDATCNPGRPVPVLMMHGDADPLVPYSSVAAATPVWLKINHCLSTSRDVLLPDRDPADGTRVIRHVYRGCPASAPVVLYQIQNGGHSWPGGTPYPVDLGKSTRDVDANEVIWAFVSRFHL